MYRFQFIFIAVVLQCAFLASANGATLAEERSRLAALQQSLGKQQEELKEMRVELDGYPSKLVDAGEALLKAEQELATLQRELAELKRQAELDDSPSLSREIPIKEHAVNMAERRVRSENRMLERYRRYHDNLREDVAKAESDIAQLNRRIAEQNQRVAQAQTPAGDAAAQTLPAITPPPSSAALPPQQATPAGEPNLQPEPAAAVAEVAPRPALSEEDHQALRLADSTMTRVEELVAASPNTSPRYTNLQLTGSDIESVPFVHLGANQYQAEVILTSGHQRFRIDNLRFRANIAAENAGETYVFIVDASDRQRLKANYFKRSLLAYRGTEPSVQVASRSAQPSTQPAMERVTLASGKTVELSNEDAFALEVARDHLALLADLKLDMNRGEANSRYSLSGNLVENTALLHLGQDQYRAEVTVQSGRQSIRINRSNFRIEVPEADDGETYLFFVDASRPNRLQLTYYKKALLQYL